MADDDDFFDDDDGLGAGGFFFFIICFQKKIDAMADTLQTLNALAKELQWTAMSTKIGAVTVSSEGSDLDRQLAAVRRAARARDRALQTSRAAPMQQQQHGEAGAGRNRTGEGAQQVPESGGGDGLLDLHEEYVRLRSIHQLMQFRPVVLDAAFGEKEDPGHNEQRQALKAAIV